MNRANLELFELTATIEQRSVKKIKKKETKWRKVIYVDPRNIFQLLYDTRKNFISEHRLHIFPRARHTNVVSFQEAFFDYFDLFPLFRYF